MSTPVISKPIPPLPTSNPAISVFGQDRDGNDIRRFNDEGWQQQIDRAVSALRPGASGAVIAVGTLERQELAVVQKFTKDGSFSVVGTLTHRGRSNWKSWSPTIAIRKEW